MFDLPRYVRLILDISGFDFETHGPALKSFSPLVEDSIREWLQENEPSSLITFETAWRVIEPVQLSDPADLIFLISERHHSEMESEDALRLLRCMNKANIPAFHYWCGLYLQSVGIWYSLRAGLWMMLRSEMANWFVELQMHEMMRLIRLRPCKDGRILADAVGCWIESGNYPRSLLNACHDYSADDDMFPRISGAITEGSHQSRDAVLAHNTL